MTKFLVRKDGIGILGTLSQTAPGWRFYSWTQRGNGRKYRGTPHEAIPRTLRRYSIIIEADTADAALDKVWL